MKKKNDLMLIGGLLLAAALLWLLFRPGGAGGWAVVIEDGVETARYPLNVECTATIGGENYNVLRISGGVASVIEANCGDHTCIRTGAVSRTGETIVCLPHHLVIRIAGGGAAEFDASTG